MNQISERRSAFPRVVTLENGAILDFPGMSLRDYFAAAALTGILANNKDYKGLDHEAMSASAWMVADYMIDQRGAE